MAFVLLLTSCAERYSTRKRIVSKSTKTQKNETTKQKSNLSKTYKIANKNTNSASEKIKIDSREKATISKSVNSQQRIVINQAMSYLGTPYKYGGTTPKGFDCSGFVGASFKPLDISLHRTSHEMANQGKNVELKDVQVGDLLFFVTRRNKRISHVGIVIETGNEIKFIHSSTSRGVIISSLNEGYWSKAYRKAKRVIM